MSGFVARTLDPVGIAALDAHLADCAPCRKLVFALAPVEQPAARQRIGRFELLDVIGRGSMGIVYRARDPELDRVVAIKARLDRAKLAADAEERLRREARALARLSHPNVVTVYEAGSDGGVAYIAMEYVEGVTLDAWIVRDEPQRAEIVAQVVAAGRGLAAAHARGLVHRDFKPSNVLVAATGVAKVGDFGLVRVDASDDPALQGTVGELAMTSPGVLVGTPAYMAPEQLRGGVATEASDQFSFCVTLFEALYGRRPFAGDSVGELVLAIERGPSIPLAPRSPRRIRRALERGLAADPARRYPSLDALLAALSPRWSRRLWLGGVAAGGAALIALAIAQGTAHGIAPCSGSEMHVREVWNPAWSAAGQRTFAATGLPFARDAWVRASAELDDYASGWIAAHQRACLAGTRGETSPAVLDVRMQCLAHRLDDLAAVAYVFAGADASVVRRASVAVDALPAIERCLDLDANVAQVPPPADPVTHASVERIRKQLAAARVTLDAGRFAPALDAVKPLVAEARALRYAPVVAEALFLLGRAEIELEHGDEARAALDEAARTAYGAHHDEVAARAWIDLVYAAQQRHDLQAGTAAAEMARAALARVPASEPKWHVQLAELEAVLLHTSGDYRAALAKHREALALATTTLPASDDNQATIRNNLANTLAALGEPDEAISRLREAIAIRERGIGARHPDSAETRGNLARMLVAQRGDFAAAATEYDRAIEVMEASVGDHPALATLLANSCYPLQALGRTDEALARARRAHHIFERQLGASHPTTATALTQLAGMLAAKQRAAEAVPLYRQALAIQEARLGKDHPSLATTLNNLGFALLDIKDARGAAAHFERALVIIEASLGRDHQRVAYSLVGLAQAYVVTKPARAVMLARRAVAIFDARHATEEERAEARRVLAAALAAR